MNMAEQQPRTLITFRNVAVGTLLVAALLQFLGNRDLFNHYYLHILTVIGMNSIAVYVMSWTMEPFVRGAVDRHFGWALSAISGPTFQPVVQGFAVVLVFWLILFWMYRRKIFLRI